MAEIAHCALGSSSRPEELAALGEDVLVQRAVQRSLHVRGDFHNRPSNDPGQSRCREIDRDICHAVRR
jgi:hypothetical protein